MAKVENLVFSTTGPDGMLRVTLEAGQFLFVASDEYGNTTGTKISGPVASHLIAAIKLKLEGK